jgi:hypothetical protein
MISSNKLVGRNVFRHRIFSRFGQEHVEDQEIR